MHRLHNKSATVPFSVYTVVVDPIGYWCNTDAALKTIPIYVYKKKMYPSSALKDTEWSILQTVFSTKYIREDAHNLFLFSGRTTRGVRRVNPPAVGAASQ